jgi:DNA-binding IclR family transcriptional regulator
MKSERRTEAYPGTQAVVRAMGLLKAFSPARPERGLADLARTLGLNKTTAYRLLAALESEGMVERVPDGDGYRLGPELFVLGGQARGAQGLREASRPTLAALASDTRETATLEVLVGFETMIVEEAMGRHVLGSMPSLGTRWPAHATSTGKSILAHLREDERARLFPRVLRRITPRTVTDRAALERELGRVRERGFALSQEELEPGYVAVGAPVRGGDGRAVAAISVGGPRVRLNAETVAGIARRLPEAAAEIQERLGWRAGAPGARKENP